jgi:hypothetical protein
MGHFRLSDTVDSMSSVAASPVKLVTPGPGGRRPAPIPSLLAILQDGVVLGTGGRSHVLRPIWAAEAMHRAYSLNQLVKRLNAGRVATGSAIGPRIERYLAVDIARLYRTASHFPASAGVSCSATLRDLAVDLVALFGGGAGNIALETHVEPVSLPGFQGRALVLAVSELIINGLTHAFPAGRSGTMWLNVQVVGPYRARLQVIDDGIGCCAPGGHEGIVATLAELLESELICRVSASGGTIAEITFPLPIPLNRQFISHPGTCRE